MFFQYRYKELGPIRPALDGVQFSILSSEECVTLEEPFSIEELRSVIWGCNGRKVPRPGGFNLDFIKKSWVIINYDLLEFIQEFHGNAVLTKAIT